MNNPFTDIIISTATPARPVRSGSGGLINTSNGADDIANTISKLNTKLKELGMEVDEQKSAISPLIMNNISSPTVESIVPPTYTSRPLPSLPKRQMVPHNPSRYEQSMSMSISSQHPRRYRLSLGEEANTVRSRFANDEIDKVFEHIEEIKRIIGDFDASAILHKIGYYDPEFVEMNSHDEGDAVSDISSMSGSMNPTQNHMISHYFREEERLIAPTAVTPGNGHIGMQNNLAMSNSRPHPGQRFLSRAAAHVEVVGTGNEDQHGNSNETNDDAPNNLMIVQNSNSDEISPLSFKSPLTIQTENDEEPLHGPHGSLSPTVSQRILQRQPFGATISSLPAGNLNMSLTDSGLLMHQNSTARNLFSDTIGSNRVSQRYSAGLNMRAVSIKLSASATQGLLNTTTGNSEPLSPRELFPALQRESSIHAMRIITPGKSNQLFQLQQSKVLTSSEKNPLALTLDSNTLLNISNHGDPVGTAKQLFAEFDVIGINPAVLKGEQSFSNANTQACEVLCTLPTLQDGKSLIVDNLHEYVFPQGAKLTIMTSTEYKRHHKQNFFEPKHKILQFTDSTNRIFHAYSLIIHEKVVNPSPILIEKLIHVQELNLAVETIIKYFRHYQMRKVKQRVSKVSKPGIHLEDNQRSSLDGNHSVASETTGKDKSNNQAKRHRPGSRIRNLVSSALKPIKDTLIGKKSVSTKSNVAAQSAPAVKKVDDFTKANRGRAQSVTSEQLTIEDDSTHSIQYVQDGEFSTTTQKKRSLSVPDYSGIAQQSRLKEKGSLTIGMQSSGCQSPTPMQSLNDRSRSNESAPSVIFTESFSTDQSHPQDEPVHPSSKLVKFRESLDRIRERVVIQQKAFCILSEAPLPVLFFKMLQTIVDLEQRCGVEEKIENENSESDSRAIDPSPARAPLQTTSQIKFQLKQCSFITKFLSSMQSQDQKVLMKNLRKGDVSLSCLPLIPSLKIPRQPPTLAEWTVAMLFSFLPVEVILHIHSLLLVEKSLIVIGQDETITTIVTTAFVNLLLPLKWAGIFVPLLPPLALEVLDAPLPYIIGLNLSGVYGSWGTKRPKLPISPAAAILYIDDFLDHPRSYQSKREHKMRKVEIVEDKLDSYSSMLGPAPSTFSTLSQSSPMAPQSSRPEKANHGGRTISSENRWNFDRNFEYTMDYLFFETPLQLEMDLSDIFPSTTASSPLTTIESKASVLKFLMIEVANLSRQFKWDCEHCGLVQISPQANSKTDSPGLREKINPNSKSSSVGVISREAFVKCALMDFDPIIYRPIREILNLFHAYNDKYTGGVLRSFHAWQDICHEDPYSRALVVDAEKIMDPLRQRLCIQEHVLRTQMFALMLDGQFGTYWQHLHQRRFICDWFIYQIRKNRKKAAKSKSVVENARKSRSVPFFTSK